jgi:uncharacterized protein YdeI (YjbR/CyaY-like superfamily)
MIKPSEKVDAYIDKNKKHSVTLSTIREVILDFPFEETIKWGMPTYVYGGRNLLGMGAFKNHVGLWFFQGALLDDPDGILRNAQEGKTKAMRQVNYESKDDMSKEELVNLIEQTISNQDKGLFVKVEKKKSNIVLPSELEEAFRADKELQACFESLSPGKKREYAEHVGSAKREATRIKRLETTIPLIKAGRGLYDKYKNC